MMNSLGSPPLPFSLLYQATWFVFYGFINRDKDYVRREPAFASEYFGRLLLSAG